MSSNFNFFEVSSENIDNMRDGRTSVLSVNSQTSTAHRMFGSTTEIHTTSNLIQSPSQSSVFTSEATHHRIGKHNTKMTLDEVVLPVDENDLAERTDLAPEISIPSK